MADHYDGNCALLQWWNWSLVLIFYGALHPRPRSWVCVVLVCLLIWSLSGLDLCISFSFSYNISNVKKCISCKKKMQCECWKLKYKYLHSPFTSWFYLPTLPPPFLHVNTVSCGIKIKIGFALTPCSASRFRVGLVMTTYKWIFVRPVLDLVQGFGAIASKTSHVM